MTDAAASTARVAVVTGGARGLGRAIAERLAQNGVTVVLADIDGEGAKATAAELTKSGWTAIGVQIDVADESSVSKAFAAVQAARGRVDILVNSAGVQGLEDGKRPLVETMSLAVWQQTLDVNLTGTFLACRAAIPLMKRGKWGRIVNIASRAPRMRTGLGNSNYAASKAGLIGFSRVMAGEVGRDGITVNCVAPSRIPTAMTLALTTSAEAFERNIVETAVGRLATPRDVADAIVFLASEAASFITGSVMDVNGGSFMA